MASYITAISERLVICLTKKFNCILKFHLAGNKFAGYFLFEIVNNLLNNHFIRPTDRSCQGIVIRLKVLSGFPLQ